jgi:hypothetical protein
MAPVPIPPNGERIDFKASMITGGIKKWEKE